MEHADRSVGGLPEGARQRGAEEALARPRRNPEARRPVKLHNVEVLN